MDTGRCWNGQRFQGLLGSQGSGNSTGVAAARGIYLALIAFWVMLEPDHRLEILVDCVIVAWLVITNPWQVCRRSRSRCILSLFTAARTRDPGFPDALVRFKLPSVPEPWAHRCMGAALPSQCLIPRQFSADRRFGLAVNTLRCYRFAPSLGHRVPAQGEPPADRLPSLPGHAARIKL